MPHPSDILLLNHPNSIWGRVQIIKSLIMQLFPASRYFMSLTSKYYSKYPVLKHPQSSKSLRVRDPGFTCIKNMNEVELEVLEWKDLAK
jgi:hypothetical protein